MQGKVPRARNGSQGSRKSAEQVLAEDGANKWLTSLYQSQYGSALRAL
jgi:hypothetical protein